jgi:prevent-host-death family protein
MLDNVASGQWQFCPGEVAMEQVVSVSEAEDQFAELLKRVVTRHDRIIVSQRGKTVGALVGKKDLQRLEEMEERERILKRIRAIEKSTKKYIPYEQFVREYEKKWGVNLAAMIAEDADVRD